MPYRRSNANVVNAYQYILEKHTNPASLEYDEQGFPHHLTGETLEPQEREFLQTRALTGFDNDSGMTMGFTATRSLKPMTSS
jgi:hypothetical protein